MDAATFNNKLNDSNLEISRVLEKSFNREDINKDLYPGAYDEDGNLQLKFESVDSYNTYCPFHGDQSNGDSFSISNESGMAYCFNGACAYSQKPISYIDIVLSVVFELDHSIVFEFELAKDYFWQAARYLVENFGDEIGVTLSDIAPKKSGEKTDPKYKILQEAMDYYHFTGTGNKFNNRRLKNFLTKTRHLDNGLVEIDKIIEDYKLGITPRDKDFKRNQLYNYLKGRKYSDEDILASRLCYESKTGEIFDFFTNRVIVPYINKGRAIGLYGRDIKWNGNKKWRHLRLEGTVDVPNGLDRVLRSEEFILVEGEFSKIAVVALGDENVMETRGVNGFKTSHAEMIQKVRERNPDMCKRAYIAFDPDAAGADSVDKIGKRLIDVGVEVKVLRLPVTHEKDGTPNYIDPNDLLQIYKKDAPKEYEKLKKESISYDAFLLIKGIKDEGPRNHSEARMAFKRMEKYLENISKTERIFIIEEVIEALDLNIEDNILREYLKDAWM